MENSIELKSDIVKFQNASFEYGRGENTLSVLKNLNMSVKQSGIYALLGPSGCGKTTLLSCIVGIKKITNGDLHVLNHNMKTKKIAPHHRNIGYMPQDLSLYGFFKIKEIFKYFGWLYGLSNTEIRSELKILYTLLHLPNKEQYIKNLSGGQGRRVSLAVALIHKPQLLILDEPTVGVDSLVRYKIWTYLKELTQREHTTVIITTHYIEEAIEAQCIGLMRKGRLLAEDSPQKLMESQNCSTLEQAFLILAEQDENGQAIEQNITENSSPIKYYKIREPSPKFQLMKATLYKNFLRSLRNPLLLMFIFVIPIFQSVFFCLCIGRPVQHLDIAVVNQEWLDIENCPLTTGCNFTHVSCRFLSYLDPETFNQVKYPDLQSAREAFDKAQVWGIFHFEPNASSTFKYSLFRGLIIPDEDENSDVDLWIDKSVEMAKFEMAKNILDAYRSFAKDFLNDCEVNSGSMNSVLRIKGINGDADSSYQSFVIPAIVMSAILILSIAPTAGSIINEKRLGLTQRSVIAGVSNLQICFSHLITEGIAMCIQITIILTSLYFLFGFKFEGNYAIVFLLTATQGFCGMAFGVLMSQMCEYEQTTTYVALSICYPLLCISGIIWPLESMPEIVRFLANLLPLTRGVAAQRAMFTKGFSFHDTVILAGFVFNIVWIIIFLALTVVVSKIKK